MKNHICFAAAAALALAGLSAAQEQHQDLQNQQPQERTQQVEQDREHDQMEMQARDEPANQVHRDGQQVDEASANNIRGTLATITEAALTKGQFRSVVQRLTEADQDRIGEYARQEFEELDGRIAQFQQDWQARYGQDFDIDNRELVYPPQFVQIFQGHIGEAGLAAERMDPQQDQQREQDGLRLEVDQDRDEARVELDPDRDRDEARAEADRERQDDEARPARARDRDRDREDPDQDRATVIVPASHGLPEVTVHLVNQGTIMEAWRIDLPDHVDGPQLRENLLLHLTIANERMQQWPVDVNEAYRMVTHHVLLAIMDVHPDEYEDAQPAGHLQDTELQPLERGQDQQMDTME